MSKKLLAEFLKEQQEPFSLDNYLLEKGYNFLKRSSRKRRYYAVANCSNFVKAVFSRLVLNSNGKNNDDQKIKKVGNGGQKIQEHNIADELDEFSRNSCSEYSSSNFFSEEEGDADRKLKWRSKEDGGNKDLSPVSVLEETEPDVASPVHEKQHNIKTTTQESSSSSSTSTYRYKSRHLTHYSVEDPVPSNSYEQYAINKRALQQNQLLIDCVREVIENHRKRDKERKQLNKILGSDELWKLLCENVWLWSQDSIDETNIIHLLHCDFLASVEEWSRDCEQQKEEICMEIGDAILEGIINEIVEVL